jgi:hypothetical protein
MVPDIIEKVNGQDNTKPTLLVGLHLIQKMITGVGRYVFFFRQSGGASCSPLLFSCP